MRVNLLGPIEAYADDRVANMAPAAQKLRQTLAVLVLNAGRVVRSEQLRDELWEDEPPASAHTALQTYVYQLRKRFSLGNPRGGGPSGGAGTPLLSTVDSGYQLVLPEDHVDVFRFEPLLARARSEFRAGDYARARDSVAAALALWRDAALADVRKGVVLEAAARRLDDLHAAARLLRIEADLHLGRHHEVLEELTALAAREPADEALQRILMTALYRTDRRAEALRVYQRTRRAIAAELGLDPSPELQALHEAILRSDPALLRPPQAVHARVQTGGSVRGAAAGAAAVPETAVGVGAEAGAVAVAEATGGTAPLSRVGTALASGAGPALASGAALVSPSGHRTGSADGTPPRPRPAGTVSLPPAAVAMRVVHPSRVPCHPPAPRERLTGRAGALARMTAALTARGRADRPVVVVGGAPGTGKSELCLHAAQQVGGAFPDGRLYGRLLDADGRRTGHAEILRCFLRGLGATEDQLRLGATDLSLMFRTWTADRRVLVVLDDVCGPEDLTDLLPSGPDSAAVVAGRRRLFVSSSAEHIELDRLPVDDCLQLLLSSLPDHRVVQDTAGLRRLAELCCGLPGAVFAVADRLRRRPHWTAREALAWAAASPAGPGPDRTLAMLPPTVRAAARTLLSPAAPGRLTAASAAAVLSVDEQRAESLLEELVEVYLLRAQPCGDGRFSYVWETGVRREEPPAHLAAA